ncbi:MAG: hypothetical protein FGF52_05830 [Candidatus Brockarchaeota archaeon]|nr:hypothetical protein [Candidatus Brockarchaeota archaeon]
MAMAASKPKPDMASVVIMLFLILVLVLPLAYAAAKPLTDPNVQHVNILIRVKTRNGCEAPYPIIQVFHLTDRGPILIAKGSGGKNGVYAFLFAIPRVKVNRLYLPSLGKEVDVYPATNIWILAYDEKTGLLGSLTTALDPTFMNWPIDTFSAEVVLEELLGREAPSSVGVLSVPPDSETWKDTIVIEYAVWDQIWAYSVWPIGAKVDVETKERTWDPYLNRYITDWSSPGSTVVTLESGVTTPACTGKLKGMGIFQFKYILCHISIPYTRFYREKVYAADTSMDPIYAGYSISSWDGSASGSDPYITDQNIPDRSIPLTQRSDWAWTFSVGLSFNLGGNWPSVSVGLGVSRTSLPYATLHIKIGTWTSGYKVYTYGREHGFRKSYSIWKPYP